MYIEQGRSQTVNLGWAREEHFLKFLILLLFSSIFPKFFLIFFLNLMLRVGGSPTRKGPGYATDIENTSPGHFEAQCNKIYLNKVNKWGRGHAVMLSHGYAPANQFLPCC